MQLYFRAGEEFYRRAVDNLPDIVFTLDREGRFHFLNYRVEDLLGYRRDELIGQPWHHLFEGADTTRASVAFKRSSTSLDEPIVERFRLQSKGRQTADREFEVVVLPFQADSLQVPAEPAVASAPAHIFAIARDITERGKFERSMEFHASHDSLTELPNRTLAMDRLVLAITQARRNRQKLAILFLDLNRFKAVNDTFGHAVGDQLLRSVTLRLAACLREGDTLSRFGGDEFTILLPVVRTREDVRAVADKLVHSLKEPFHIEGEEICVSLGASIGIALYPEDGSSAEELTRRADVAMYKVKHRGEDGYQFLS